LNLGRKAVQGVAWSAVQRGGTQAVSFIVFTFLSRYLEPGSFGLVAIATVFVTFIQVFLDQGFSVALIQRENLEEGHPNTAFWSSVTLGAVMTLLGIIAAGFIADVYQEPELKTVLQFLSLSLLFHSLSSTQQALFRREIAFDKLTARTLSAEIVGGAVGIVMAIRGYEVWSLVGRNLSRDFTAMLVLWGASSWRPKFFFSPNQFMDLFKFGISIVGDRFFYFINRNMDQLLIGYFLGATILGYYVIGFRLASLLIKLMMETISSVAFPVFSRLQNDLGKLNQAYYRISKLSSLITVPSFIGMALIAPEIILTLFGEKWRASIEVMRVLSLLGLLQTITFLIPAVQLAVGKPSHRLAIRILKTLSMLLAIFYSVQWGIVAVAISIVGTMLLISPIMLFALKRVTNIGLLSVFKQYTSSIISSFAMIIVILSVNMLPNFTEVDSTRLIIFVLVAVATYTFVLTCLDRESIQSVFELRKHFLPVVEEI
jgi:PST family polysaccharide transporter